MSESPPSNAALEYEERKPFYRRRVARQVVLVVLAVLLWYFTPSARDLTVASWHRRCASYIAPPGQVIYDDDPTTHLQLLKDPAYTSSAITLRKDLPYALRENQDWQGLASASGGYRPAPVAFLGKRTSPGGNHRLVAVQFGALQSEGRFQLMNFMPYLETTGITGLRNYPATGGGSTRVSLYRFPTDTLRILDGIADPSDPSRFTIEVQINGTTHTIDGQLHDNDAVTLAPRNATTTLVDNVHLWSPTGVPFPAGIVPPAPATTQPATSQ